MHAYFHNVNLACYSLNHVTQVIILDFQCNSAGARLGAPLFTASSDVRATDFNFSYCLFVASPYLSLRNKTINF